MILAEIFGGSDKVIKCEFPEIIALTKLQKYSNNDIFVKIVSRIKPVKSELCLKEEGHEQLSVVLTYEISKKNCVLFISSKKYWNYTKK